MPSGLVKHTITAKTGIRISILFFLTLMLLIAGCTGSSGDSADKNPAGISGNEKFKEDIDAVINQERYGYSTWGMEAVDIDTGKTVLSMNGDQLFTPGSTTKVFTVTTALEKLGSDYRFDTPVYRTDDNLILVASGDPAMGGRGGADSDTLEFTSSDHVDAGAFGRCILVPSDPLAGLDKLAAQAGNSGITSVEDIAIDDRLFQETKLEAEGLLTPIVINDNLIDITIVPGKEGETASVDWRPKSSAYTVKSTVTTGPAGDSPAVAIPDYSGQSVIEISGTIPEGSGSINLTSNVLVPASFARSLFIDALERNGVDVAAGTGGENPADLLPATRKYDEQEKVAELISPPFPEYARVTLKVSQNLYANCLLGIIAANSGSKYPEEGLLIEGSFLDSAGVPPGSLSLSDGEGSITNRISPDAGLKLLEYAHGKEYYEVLKDAMPVFGVDGTLSNAADPRSPGYGNISAKTGTSLGLDMSGKIFAYTRGLLGYMKTGKGTDLAFVIYVNNVAGIESVEEVSAVVEDVNRIAVLMYENL